MIPAQRVLCLCRLSFNILGFFCRHFKLLLLWDSPRVTAAYNLLATAVIAHAYLPMQMGAQHRNLNCNSCHPAHRFETAHAAIDGCLNCHADTHSLEYRTDLKSLKRSESFNQKSDKTQFEFCISILKSPFKVLNQRLAPLYPSIRTY